MPTVGDPSFRSASATGQSKSRLPSSDSKYIRSNRSPSSLTASPTPSDSSARVAFVHRWIPYPTWIAFRSGARSNTVASIPARASAIPAASPPIPAPAIRTRGPAAALTRPDPEPPASPNRSLGASLRRLRLRTARP